MSSPEIKPEWVTLQRGSDWGLVYLAESGKLLNENRMADHRLGIKFNPGDTLDIRWPDGTAETVTIVLRREECDVDRTPMVSHVPGFNVDLHGITLWIGLDQVQVWRPDLPVSP